MKMTERLQPPYTFVHPKRPVETEVIRMQIKLIMSRLSAAFVVQWSKVLDTDPENRVRFAALPDFLTSSGSGTGFTQPREYK
jgi:hypothetical protein